MIKREGKIFGIDVVSDSDLSPDTLMLCNHRGDAVVPSPSVDGTYLVHVTVRPGRMDIVRPLESNTRT